MTKILVAEDKHSTRLTLVHGLSDVGYEVIEAADGRSAFELALHELPDIILLDVGLPVMDGLQVLKRLRADPTTQDTPVIMVTALPAEEGERASMRLGVTHYITKPWAPGTVEAAVKVALREAGIADEEVGADDTANTSDRRKLIRTGVGQMDLNLGGGLPVDSLTLVEGGTTSGKSVLCQHFAYDALLAGHGVAYYTPKSADRTLVGEMRSIGRDSSAYFLAGQLASYPIEEPAPDAESEQRGDTGRLMGLLTSTIQQLPSQYGVILLDDVTELASHAHEGAIMDLFSRCRRVCDGGRTVVVAARPYAFNESTLKGVEDVCDAHLRLRSEKLGAKMIKVLEVRKLRNVELHTANTVNFDVERGVGLRIVPGGRVRV